MKKIAIVYWSGTGNTEEMANSILKGAQEVGADVVLITASSFGPEMVDNYDVIAFGCPAMGAEQLEDSEFEPMYLSCKSKLSGKKLALFGSYGWGSGEWMTEWENDCKAAGAELVHTSIVCNESPDATTLEALQSFGKALSQ